MYEPRTGDMVTAEVSLNGVATVLRVDETGLVLIRSGAGYKYALPTKAITPLRPDAPGQRVRHEGSPVLVGRVLDRPVGRVIEVAWEAGYGRSVHEPGRLIRIADQAPAAPVADMTGPTATQWGGSVVVPCAMCENCGAAAADGDTEDGVALCGACAQEMDGAPVPVEPEFAPGSVQWTTGPTCQHCGSNVLVGLLRDTCPRGCDLALRAKEPEPDHVGTRLVPMRCGHEAVWIARGRGAIGTPHPTREGAIAAWREAVRR